MPPVHTHDATLERPPDRADQLDAIERRVLVALEQLADLSRLLARRIR